MSVAVQTAPQIVLRAAQPAMIEALPEAASVEDALLERVGRNDVQAFETLYDRCSSAVYSLAMKMLRKPQAAEEITQDVFLAVWRGAREFDRQRGRARTWILSLAHHKSVDAVRRHRLRLAEPLSDSIPADADAAQDALRGLEGARVRKALEVLSEGQRQAIVLAYYGGYSQQDIARRIGAPLGTVKTRMRDGMLRLRAALAPEILVRQK